MEQIKNNMAAHDSNPQKKKLFEQVMAFGLENELSDLRSLYVYSLFLQQFVLAAR